MKFSSAHGAADLAVVHPKNGRASWKIVDPIHRRAMFCVDLFFLPPDDESIGDLPIS